MTSDGKGELQIQLGEPVTTGELSMESAVDILVEAPEGQRRIETQTATHIVAKPADEAAGNAGEQASPP